MLQGPPWVRALAHLESLVAGLEKLADAVFRRQSAGWDMREAVCRTVERA